MGNTCKPLAVSFQCMTKSTTNKKKKKKEKKKAQVNTVGLLWILETLFSKNESVSNLVTQSVPAPSLPYGVMGVKCICIHTHFILSKAFLRFIMKLESHTKHTHTHAQRYAPFLKHEDLLLLPISKVIELIFFPLVVTKHLTCQPSGSFKFAESNEL